MPATTTELKQKMDFRGDLLDVKHSVHFDPQTGTYSYDYADLTPEVKAAIEKLVFKRISSPKLAEIEEAVSVLRKGVEPAAPREQGEISKATEAYTTELEEASEVAKKLQKKMESEELSNAEKTALNKSQAVIVRLQFQDLVGKAKKQLNAIENLKNEGEYNKAPPEKQAEYDEQIKTSQETIDAFETVERLREEYPSLTSAEEEAFINALLVLGAQEDITEEQREFYDPAKLTEEQQKTYAEDPKIMKAFETLQKIRKDTTMKDEDFKALIQAILQFNSLDDEMWYAGEANANVANTQEYENARAKILQIEGTPEEKRTPKQLQELANAFAKRNAYEEKHPEAKTQREEEKAKQERALKAKEEKPNENAGALFEGGGKRFTRKKYRKH
jgi:hypothetical protein